MVDCQKAACVAVERRNRARMESTHPTPVKWHAAILTVLSDPNWLRLSGLNGGTFYTDVMALMPPGTRANHRAMHAGIWTLVRLGLAYLDFVDSGTGRYTFDAYVRLTEAGA